MLVSVAFEKLVLVLLAKGAEHLEPAVLEPVYLLGIEDSMEHMRESGSLLQGLEEKGLIRLDYYDETLQGCDYVTTKPTMPPPYISSFRKRLKRLVPGLFFSMTLV